MSHMNDMFRQVCCKGDMGAVRNLLERDCSVSYLSGEEQEALLLHACHQGDLFVADVLITNCNGCNVNCSIRWESWSFFPNTCTPLIVAAYAGQDQIVKNLILAGAKVGMKDFYGYTALDYAADSSHNIQWRILLVEGGARMRSRLSRSSEFAEAIHQTSSFATRKVLCIIGNAEAFDVWMISQCTAVLNLLFMAVQSMEKCCSLTMLTSTNTTVPTKCSWSHCWASQ